MTSKRRSGQEVPGKGEIDERLKARSLIIDTAVAADARPVILLQEEDRGLESDVASWQGIEDYQVGARVILRV